MADPQHLAMLNSGVAEWNSFRAATSYRTVDLSGADLRGAKLNDASLLKANLAGALLTKTQLERAHLTDADLTGATLEGANLQHVNARNAVFDGVVADHALFSVSTLRGAHFRKARLTGARFHRAYLREADLTEADFTGAWMRFATFEGAICVKTNFSSADLRYATMVGNDLRGANLTDVHVFGVSAWACTVDASTREDLIVRKNDEGDGPLRAHDLHTAQLLALMLDRDGIRRVFDSLTSKLVLVLGSFSTAEKPVLDALRTALQAAGYVAVTFDFDRPAGRDYAETVLSLVGMSRFVVADFTNAKEVRAEVAQAHSQYQRVPIVPIVRDGMPLPITMANSFSAEELGLLVRYKDTDELVRNLQVAVVDPAEARASRIAENLRKAENIILGR